MNLLSSPTLQLLLLVGFLSNLAKIALFGSSVSRYLKLQQESSFCDAVIFELHLLTFIQLQARICFEVFYDIHIIAFSVQEICRENKYYPFTGPKFCIWFVFPCRFISFRITLKDAFFSVIITYCNEQGTKYSTHLLCHRVGKDGPERKIFVFSCSNNRNFIIFDPSYDLFIPMEKISAT